MFIIVKFGLFARGIFRVVCAFFRKVVMAPVPAATLTITKTMRLCARVVVIGARVLVPGCAKVVVSAEPT